MFCSNFVGLLNLFTIFFPGDGSLLLVSALTEAQSCCLVAVDILCQLGCYPQSIAWPFAAVLGTQHAELAAADIISDLTKLLDPDNETWNCTRPFYLQIVSLH